jgi:hypothetical protein
MLSWDPIRNSTSTSVSRLVSFGNVPAKVDDALVLTIQAQLQANPLEQAHLPPPVNYWALTMVPSPAWSLFGETPSEK